MTKRAKQLLTGAGVLLLALVAFTGTARAATTAGAATVSYLGKSGYPRGMRNNNPGNIRIGSSPWQGKIPINQNTDGAFEQFTSYAYGIRAMIKNLLNYNLNTLRGIIYKWAPPGDNNDTDAYVNFVALRTGINPTATINLKDAATLRKIVMAMAEMENGRPAITTDQFNYAYSII